MHQILQQLAWPLDTKLLLQAWGGPDLRVLKRLPLNDSTIGSSLKRFRVCHDIVRYQASSVKSFKGEKISMLACDGVDVMSKSVLVGFWSRPDGTAAWCPPMVWASVHVMLL